HSRSDGNSCCSTPDRRVCVGTSRACRARDGVDPTSHVGGSALRVPGLWMVGAVSVVASCVVSDGNEQSPGEAAPAADAIEFHPDGAVTAGGMTYSDVIDFQTSADFQHNGRRCASQPANLPENLDVAYFAASDCSFLATRIQSDYDPKNGDVLEI